MASQLSKVNTLWQAIGGSILAPILIVLILIDNFMYNYLSAYATFMWLNLAFLFFHEFEDYILNPNGLKHFFIFHSGSEREREKEPMLRGIIE